jgi:hypothetical protein
MSYQPGYKEAKEAVAEGNAADDDALVEWMKSSETLSYFDVFDLPSSTRAT